jgi:protein-arginine deiminase
MQAGFFLLALLVASAVGSSYGQTGPAIGVFADLDQTGDLAGPLEPLPGSDREFGIVVPLPTACGEVEVLPEPEAGGEDLSGRLGRLLIVAAAGSQIGLELKSNNTGQMLLYMKSPAGWRRAGKPGGSWTLTVDESGVLEAGIAARLVEPKDEQQEAGWPGAGGFAVEVVAAGNNGAKVSVPFRVAPFIIPCSLDPVDEMLVVEMEDTAGAVKGLEAIATDAGIKLNVHLAKPPCDQWMQDTIEPGVFAFPSAGETVLARGALTGLRAKFWNTAAGLDQQVSDRLQETGAVTVAAGPPRDDTRWIDWFGNLEVTPPHTGPDGRQFRYGRILTGKQNDLAMHPQVMGFLEAQAVQWPPIVVDTSWLMIGHVDEVVNFLPAKTACGFRVLLPSPEAARDLLDRLTAEGHGELPLFEGTRDATTVRKLRETIGSSAENRIIDETVTSIREQLRRELSLAGDDFVMLPVLFDRGGALIPNAVNGAVVNGHYFVTAPRGPRVAGGDDLFESSIRDLLAGCDAKVHFIDGWRAYHVMGGEIHCGTNTLRRLSDPEWWKPAQTTGDGGE